MNGADPERWSTVADGWAESWGQFADPAREALIAGASVHAGDRVLDVGCGTGEFLQLLTDAGAMVAGVDPAGGMIELAQRAVPSADVRRGDFSRLPWPNDQFDVVVAVNALQFTTNRVVALREASRVLGLGGRVGIANWAEARLNDIDTVENAATRADRATPAPDEAYRCAGGLETLLEAAGLSVVAAGLVSVPWTVPDEVALVRGILLGEPPSRIAALRDIVVAAAQPFAAADGYVLHNAFRFAVGYAAAS